VLALCAVLVFVPVKYIYPSRTRYHKKLMLGLTTVWGIGIFSVLLKGVEQMPVWFSVVSTVMLAVYVGASLMATFRPDRI
jgi:phosphatidylcholine synthase